MHEVFDKVVQAFMTGKPEPQDKVLAYKLRVALAGSFSVEDRRRQAITELLHEGLFDPIGLFVQPTPIPESDGKCYTTDGSAETYGINIEFKNEKGVGGGDPYMQNLGYYVHFMARAPTNLDKHCCPWLLI
jgi:hypothetical protein